MRRSWRLRKTSGDIVILRESDVQPGDASSILPREFASNHLEDALRNRAAWPTLLSLYEELTGNRPFLVDASQMEGIVSRLVRWMENGRLVALWQEQPRFSGGAVSGRPAKSTGSPPEELPPPEPVPEKSWVEIEFLGEDEPPTPIAHARYRIVLPDDSVREGWLDANGRARLVGIPAGLCKVTFPELDLEAWSAME